MADNQTDLSALLCSKLCHDLLSPVGAMNNGLELLADENDPEMQQRCMDLLADSARAAADKLKFFRLAFGSAGGYGDTIDPREALAVIQPIVGASGRTQLEWAVPDGMLPKRAIKVLLNLVLIANEAMVRGGTLMIGAENRGTEQEIAISVEGPRILLDAQIRACLIGEKRMSEIDARTAAAWMAYDLAHRNGGTLQLGQPSENQLVIGAIIRD